MNTTSFEDSMRLTDVNRIGVWFFRKAMSPQGWTLDCDVVWIWPWRRAKEGRKAWWCVQNIGTYNTLADIDRWWTDYWEMRCRENDAEQKKVDEITAGS
jgi:hypothetical protein